MPSFGPIKEGHSKSFLVKPETKRGVFIGSVTYL